MQRFQSVGANNFAYNYNLTLPHASQVFVTVVAKNSAGLRYAAYSFGLNIDQTPPVIDKIHDGAGNTIYLFASRLTPVYKCHYLLFK